MKRWIPVFLILAVWVMLFFPAGRSASKAEMTLDVELSDYAYYGGDYDGVDRAAKSVFYVEARKSGKKETGSGFVLFDECLFITNQHVIDGASYLRIMDDYGEQNIIDQVIVSDREHDIAILLLPEEARHYDPLEYDAAFSELKRMQSVIAIGSPEGLVGTISDGIISGFRLFKNSDIRYIQITAPISHGSSGGCLLNEDLKVIGVTSSGVDKGENLNFAIPVFIVEKLYQQWNKQDTVQLGSEESWDTVGHGLHERISGKAVPQPDDTPAQASTPAPTPEPTPEPTQTPTPTPRLLQKGVQVQLKKTATKVKLYSGPGNDYVLITKINTKEKNETEVFFIENDKAFTYLHHSMPKPELDVYAYISTGAFMDDQLNDVPVIDGLPWEMRTVKKEAVPREGPRKSYREWKNVVVPEGTSVKYFFTENDFCFVEYETDDGPMRFWVPLDCME